MDELATVFHLMRFCRVSEWPALIRFLFLKMIRRPAQVELKLRGHRWVAMTTKSSGLRFFREVVVDESYARSREDILACPDPLVIDGGANCGAFALWALSLKPGVRVISFEPGEAFENLEINRRFYVEHHGGQWQVEKCALFSKVGMGHFTQDRKSSMGRMSEGSADLVPIRTLDDLGLAPQIIKIDVEGSELEVLKGGEKTLDGVKTIILEYHTPELRAQCMEFLSARHFQLEEERTLLIGRK